MKCYEMYPACAPRHSAPTRCAYVQERRFMPRVRRALFTSRKGCARADGLDAADHLQCVCMRAQSAREFVTEYNRVLKQCHAAPNGRAQCGSELESSELATQGKLTSAEPAASPIRHTHSRLKYDARAYVWVYGFRVVVQLHLTRRSSVAYDILAHHRQDTGHFSRHSTVSPLTL